MMEGILTCSKGGDRSSVKAAMECDDGKAVLALLSAAYFLAAFSAHSFASAPELKRNLLHSVRSQSSFANLAQGSV